MDYRTRPAWNIAVAASILTAITLSGGNDQFFASAQAQTLLDSGKWNRKFTQLIRVDRPTTWGNWSLDTNISPGAVGVLTSNSGTFEKLGALPRARTIDRKTNAKWSMLSEGVSGSVSNLGLGGKFTDPETGLQVEGGLVMSWSFATKGLIASHFDIVNEQVLEDTEDQILANFEWLKDLAHKRGWAPDGTITQGFGVITEVIWANSGLNIASRSDTSTFSIGGSIKGGAAEIGASETEEAQAALEKLPDQGEKPAKEGTDAATGGGLEEANFSGGYAGYDSNTAFDGHLWPATKNTIPQEPIPIAFKFATFIDNKLLSPWIGAINEFQITISNNPGGTWIVDNDLVYDVAGEKFTDKVRTSGGITKTIRGIPLDAKNIELTMWFMTGPKIVKKWRNPVVEIPGGTVTLDVRGVAPNNPEVTVR